MMISRCIVLLSPITIVPSCVAEYGAETEPEGHYDPEVPEGGRGTCD